jgi:hypothetical protein
LEFSSDGTVHSDWWTPEAGDMLCALCGKCPGWESVKKPLDCVAGNRWCG